MKRLNQKGISTRHKSSVIGKASTAGITLIALIITIIVLLILAGITISLTIGERGVIKYAQEAGVKSEEATAREKLELALVDLQADKATNPEYNENEYIDNYLSREQMVVIGDIVLVDGWQFQIDRSVPKIISDGSKVDNNYKDENLISKISKISSSGYHEIEIKGKTQDGTEETVKYNVHAILYNEDLILDGINQVDGSVLTNQMYEFGDNTTDVATETEDAKNMVVVKVNGNLTINEGVTLTACKSDSGYGGPKGMMIYCTGILTNNGTISMTARGARAEGQNVYLWKNIDNNYEYVPAIGGIGGEEKKVYGNYWMDSVTTNISYFGNNGRKR